MNKIAQVIGYVTIIFAVLGAFGIGDYRWCYSMTGVCFK